MRTYNTYIYYKYKFIVYLFFIYKYGFLFTKFFKTCVFYIAPNEGD